MVCSAKTSLSLLSMRGGKLANLDSAGLENHGAALSPDGRFFAAATFTSDVKVGPAFKVFHLGLLG